MPKLIVLFYGVESPASTLAEAVADGAKSVRFTEVDVRAGSSHELTTGKRYKVLEAPNRLVEYDGVVIAAPAAGDVPTELEDLIRGLEHIASAGAFANTVFAVIGGDNTVLLGHVARLGGIIVSEAVGVDDPEARARSLGQRSAKVVAWVRHSLAHEDAHEHSHAAGHRHSDDAPSGERHREHHHGHDHHDRGDPRP